MIDFWGKGFDLIERMGLLPDVERSGYRIQEVRFVHADGSRAGGFSTDGLRRATGGRFTSLPRSDLAEIIWRALPSSIETRFGDEVKQLEQEGDAVRVHFANSSTPKPSISWSGPTAFTRRYASCCSARRRGSRPSSATPSPRLPSRGYGPRTTDTYMGYGVPGRQRFARVDA